LEVVSEALQAPRQQDDTLGKVEDLTKKSEEMTNSQMTLSADFYQLRAMFFGSILDSAVKQTIQLHV
jgi:GTP:adenosylcobinamide-phosphate guanylyltransferase